MIDRINDARQTVQNPRSCEANTPDAIQLLYRGIDLVQTRLDATRIALQADDLFSLIIARADLGFALAILGARFDLFVALTTPDIDAARAKADAAPTREALDRGSGLDPAGGSAAPFPCPDAAKAELPKQVCVLPCTGAAVSGRWS
jgi:hypothetical protein